MNCEHGVPEVPTCDEDVCPTCYGEALEREPYRPAKPLPPLPDMTVIGGHSIIRADTGSRPA